MNLHNYETEYHFSTFDFCRATEEESSKLGCYQITEDCTHCPHFRMHFKIERHYIDGKEAYEPFALLIDEYSRGIPKPIWKHIWYGCHGGTQFAARMICNVFADDMRRDAKNIVEEFEL